ncbi:MAG: hypothetical protein U9O41_08480, partial [Candidatus Aerophobetes bacterium]|nr:hypothetical protein [Candidatus Aerophobetes bacterium]
GPVYFLTFHLLVYNRFWYPTKSLLNKVGRQTLYNLPIHLYHCIIFDIIDKNYPLPKRQNINLGVYDEDKKLSHFSNRYRCP